MCLKKEEIQKSSIRVDSSSDEIPTEYLHTKCTDLTFYECAGCGLNNNEHCILNVYRSPARESAQSICLCKTSQNNTYTSDPSDVRTCNTRAWKTQNRAAVTHLQIAYVPPKLLTKWGFVTSRSTMDNIFLSLGQHLLHWKLHSFRIQLIKDNMNGFMSSDAVVPNKTRQLCGLGRLSNAPLFAWYLLGWIPFPNRASKKLLPGNKYPRPCVYLQPITPWTSNTWTCRECWIHSFLIYLTTFFFQMTKLRNNEWQNELSVVDCKLRGRNRPSNLRHLCNIFLKRLNKIIRNHSKKKTAE